jgi:hypothetical protein
LPPACLLVFVEIISSTLKMEAICFSESSVLTHPARRHIPEDDSLQSSRDSIDAYRDMPSLWKVKSDCYKNKQLKEECYKKLTEILKANDPDASIANTKRKINSLRSASRGPFEDSSCNRLVRSTVIHPKNYDA